MMKNSNLDDDHPAKLKSQPHKPKLRSLWPGLFTTQPVGPRLPGFGAVFWSSAGSAASPQLNSFFRKLQTEGP